MKQFNSSLDKVTIAITTLVIVLTLSLFYRGFYMARPGSELGFIVLTILIVVMYFLRPLSVSVDGTGIIISRKVKPVTINFSEIKTVRLLQNTELFGTIRTFGNSGVFGYTGLHYNKKLGSMTWYCSQRKNYILIEKNNDKKVIITPDSPEEFLEAVRLINPGIIKD